MEGKQSLYQRVLAIPGATLHFQPAEQQAGTPITPFTAFYVYERRQADSGEWLRIGTDRYGDVVGWLRADRSLAWNQGLTVSFRNPVGHDRALLFRDDSTLRRLIEQRDMNGYNQLYEAAEAGRLPDDSPVVAMQPPGFVDIREDFYLVPILEHEDVYLGSEQARMLKVSSVPLNELPAASPKSGDDILVDSGTAPAAGSATQVSMTLDPEDPNVTVANKPRKTKRSRGYTAGLVFVIDSTLSMDPYIDRTREAVIKIYDSLADANLLGHVNFGLVAYRDNLRAAPGLEYLAKTYVTLEQGRDPGSFLKRVKSLRASKVSSRNFREDAYSGVSQAIEDIDWQGTDARYMVLITDAGAREPTDPLAGTGLSAHSLHQLSQDKGIANFVLHLLTPSRFADHKIAERQYRTLSQYPGIGDLYYGVKTGNVEEFGQVLDALAGQITSQVQAAVAGSTLSAPEADPVIATAPVPAPEVVNPQLAALQEKVAKLGYALRLRYLNRAGNHGAPSVFEAWVLDRDFRDPERRTLDIRVLLTRDQLSDMSDILKQVLEQAEEGLLSPQNFLDELKSLAATLTRDPERLGATTATTAGVGNSLSQMGFMREYIEDLPYTGEVMSLSLDDWQSWPAQRQIAFLNRLEEKISYYRALHDHTDLWVSLDGGPIDGDSVYPIALEQLP